MRKRSMPNTHDVQYPPSRMRSSNDMHAESSAIDVWKSKWHTCDRVAHGCGQRHQQGFGWTNDYVRSCLQQASVDILPSA